MRPSLRVAAACALTLLVLPSVLAPSVAAHGSTNDGHVTNPLQPPPLGEGVPPSADQAVSYYTYYGSSWLWGTAAVSVIGDQVIRQLSGDGDWLVWLDAKKNDVYAHNLAAGDGFYVTKDSSQQIHPRVSKNVVVWEDRRNGPSDIFAYYLETGETRRVTVHGTQSTNAANPDISYPWVVWEDDRDGAWQVYAHDLETGQEIKLSPDNAGSRDQSAVILGHVVVWRTYRFNVWDLLWYDLDSGESGAVTSDRAMEMPAVTSEDAFFFQKETQGGWNLYKFDPSDRTTIDLQQPISTAAPPAVSRDLLAYVSFDSGKGSFAALNLTSGYASRVTGYMPIMDLPLLRGRTLYAPVWNGTNAAILAYTISPYAIMRPPKLTLDSPDDQSVLSGPTKVRGTLAGDSGWGAPDRFVFTVNGANLTRIAPGTKWSFDLDLAQAAAGAYEVTIEARWTGAPPLTQTITVFNPSAFRGTDIEREGRAFHFARVYGLYYHWVKSNPAIVALAALILVGLALYFLRYRIRDRPVKRAEIEYVRQEPDPASAGDLAAGPPTPERN